MSTTIENRRFPVPAGVLLGLGLGGFFDGIVLHQILQWHHIATSAGYPANSLSNLELNTMLDGIFHASTYVFTAVGLLILWQSSRIPHLWWPARLLPATILMGFGAFNVVEGIVDHHLLGLHHVNGPRRATSGFSGTWGSSIWGAVMLVGGWLLFQSGNSKGRFPFRSREVGASSDPAPARSSPWWPHSPRANE